MKAASNVGGANLQHQAGRHRGLKENRRERMTDCGCTITGGGEKRTG